MPLLDDSKSVYVGTTPITKVMAGSVEVWPKVVELQSGVAHLEGNLAVEPTSGIKVQMFTTSSPGIYGPTLYVNDSDCGSQSVNVGQLQRINEGYAPDAFKFIGNFDLGDVINLTESFTLNYWFKFLPLVADKDTYSPSMFSSRPYTAQVSWKHGETDTTPLWEISDSGRDILAPNILDNNWHHFEICVKRKEGKMQFFLDGISQFTSSGSTYPEQVIQHLAVDLGGGSAFVERGVLLDEVFIINRILHESEFVPACNGSLT